MTAKLYLDAQQLLEDSCRLALKVVQSGYRPSIVVALWRGGVPIGVAVQEFLAYCGIRCEHMAIRASSYAGVGERSDEIAIDGIGEIARICTSADRLLLVDDVFDTGLTMQTVIDCVRREAAPHAPQDIRIAVPWFKPAHNRSRHEPDYWLHRTAQWLMFPQSLEGLTAQEIALHHPEFARILADANPPHADRERD